MSASIRFSGLDEVVVEVGEIPKESTRTVLHGMADVAYEAMRQGAGRHSPRSQGTGFLYKSLFKREDFAEARITVGHDPAIAPHAIFVVRPTRPHAITPRNAKMLSWLDLQDFGSGQRVFSRGVWHPGYRGDPYDEEASRAAVSNFKRIVDAAFRGL